MNINDKFLSKNYFYFLTLLLVSILLICLHVIVYVNLEQPIYYWDYKIYYKIWLYSSQLQEYSTIEWLKSILDSIGRHDYNPLPVALLFPFYHLSLDNRMAYVLAISICYFIPVVLLIILIFKKIVGYQSYLWLSCIFIFIITFTPFWGASLRGQPDIVGLIPILGVILFVSKANLTYKISVKNILIIGLLLWLPFALRRWYAYTVVSLYLTLPFLSFFIHAQENNLLSKKFYYTILNFLLSSIISLLLILIIQKELLFTILSSDYSLLYSAYQKGYRNSFLGTIDIFGLYLFPLFLIGLVWSIFSHTNTGRYLGLFSAANLAISYTLFSKIQTPYLHHHLPFSLWFFVLVILGFNFIITSINSLTARKLFLMASALFSTIIFSITFYDFGRKTKNYILPAKIYPLRVENFSNYKKLSDNIENWLSSGKTVSYFSSSDFLNEEMISSITDNRIEDYLLAPHHVDLRDKLHLEYFLTDYVMVGSPVQAHLVTGQNVITIPAQELLSGTSIGAAYQRLPYEYELSQGIKAILFKKIRPFTEQEIREFLEKFISIYPEWKDTYLTPITVSYMTADISFRENESGMVTYHVDSNVIYIYFGKNKIAQIDWDFGDMQEIIVSIPNYSCGITGGVVINLSNKDGLQKSIEVPVMAESLINITEFTRSKGTLVIDTNGSNACDGILLGAR